MPNSQTLSPGDVVKFSRCRDFGEFAISYDPKAPFTPIDFNDVPDDAKFFAVEFEGGFMRPDLKHVFQGEPAGEYLVRAYNWEDNFLFRLIVDPEADLGVRFQEVVA